MKESTLIKYKRMQFYATEFERYRISYTYIVELLATIFHLSEEQVMAALRIDVPENIPAFPYEAMDRAFCQKVVRGIEPEHFVRSKRKVRYWRMV